MTTYPQIINIGNYNDDGTGDTLRVGAEKINANFADLYAKTSNIINGVVAGDGISVSYAPATGRVTINNTRVYEPSFAAITVAGQPAITANSVGSAFSLAAGDYIRLVANATSDTVTISAILPEEFFGNTHGIHFGNVEGNVTGDVLGNLQGEVWSLDKTFKVIENANTPGNVKLKGVLTGNVIGNLTGTVYGELVGDVTGDISGNAESVTNGVYTDERGLSLVTNQMLAGQITNSKLANSSVTINSTIVPLGGSITIPEYTLPIATTNILGGIKVGNTLAINVDGILNTSQDLTSTGTPTFTGLTLTSGTITGVPLTTFNIANKKYVDDAIAAIPPYVLPTASADIKGGVRVGDGLQLNQNDGILKTAQNITTSSSPTFLGLTIDEHIIVNSPPIIGTHAVTKQYVDTLYNTIPHYSLPTASEEITGGIRIGSSLTINEEEICTTVQDINTTATPTFAGIEVPNLPASDTQVANKQYVDTYGFPIGGIIMWSGSIDTIPANWKLCNGSNGTPDLREKFVIGYGVNYPLNSNGGESTSTTNASGSHTHTATIAGTALTVDQMPAHSHNYDDLYGLQNASGPAVYDRNNTRVEKYTPWYSDGSNDSGNPAWFYSRTANAGGGQTHSHSASIDSSSTHTHTVSTIPPYYALAFIMKVS